MNVLVLLGSLRPESTNRQLANAAVAHLPESARAHVSTLPAGLPFYDESLDTDERRPALVDAFRAEVAAADAIIVVTPEYNGSVSGVVKNALDWASRPRGAAPIAGIPALVLAASGSPRGAQWAREAAVRVLQIAGAAPLAETLGVASSYAAFGAGDALLDPAVDEQLAAVIGQLLDAARTPAAA